KIFDQLRSHPQYSSTLDCPCTNITVHYQSFISIKPYYHQLCSSDFVTRNSTWISLLYSSTAGIDYAYNDYRLFAASHFELLSSLYTLVNETIAEAINEFSRNIMINARVQSRENIESQANTALNRFCLSTPRTFVLILDFIRYMNQGNGIVSSILSNWHFISSDTISPWDSLWALSHSYGNDNCSCGTSSMCISEALFNGLVIPGLHVGCYPFESLLQSTLECLYNISCIDQLKSMYNYSNITFNPLNNSLSSANTTVQSLIETLFVERWETDVFQLMSDELLNQDLFNAQVETDIFIFQTITRSNFLCSLTSMRSFKNGNELLTTSLISAATSVLHHNTITSYG
ncbi:unnamed protein product, partial [Adineta steineri]